jgi:hypothetical protein
MRLKPLYEISGYQELRVAPSMRTKQEEASKLDDSAGLIGDPASEGIDQLLPESSAPSELAESDLAPNLFPAVEWINQDQAKQLIGRAAEYQEHSNTILANQDFKGFTDLLKYFTERYTFTDETLPLVRHAILEDAEQALMEAVAGILSLRAAGSWDWGQYQAAISKEALTAVVMVRYGSVQNIELKLLGQISPKSS